MTKIKQVFSNFMSCLVEHSYLLVPKDQMDNFKKVTKNEKTN